MSKDILVAILEDDVFSRSWMALLMVRDWRTRLVAEFGTINDLSNGLQANGPVIDMLILDVDLFGEQFKIDDVDAILASHDSPARLLLTGVRPDPHIIRQIHSPRVCGYVIKEEVGISLSWVLTFAFEGQWVVTPGVFHLAVREGIPLPAEKLMLDGRKKLPGFSDHDADVARLAFVFSLGRRDLADELKISDQWSYGLVSELYEKMGLGEILSGEVELTSYIGQNPVIQSHFEEIMAQLGTSRKAKDLETLAYHLLTMPDIVE